MQRKATHQGHCQVCGSLQRLPKDVLSKHGYTTRWGFFSGVCKGAGHLPFEKDISLIKGAIISAEEQMATTKSYIKRLNNPTEPKATISVYVPSGYDSYGRRQKSHYKWEEIEIIHTSRPTGDGSYILHTIENKANGEPLSAVPYELRSKDIDLIKIAKYLNQYKVKELTRTVEQIKSYIGWQQGRIKNWSPSPLVSIEEKV